MPITAQTLIDRRVAGGANHEESQHLLAELVRSHSGDNLTSALIHQGFATATQAEQYSALHGKHSVMPSSTTCSCGFRDCNAAHILRCTAPAQFNTPRECDHIAPCPPGYLPVAGDGEL